MPGTCSLVTNSMERTTSSSSTNCISGSNPRMHGTAGSCSALLVGVMMSVPRTLEKRKSVTTTWGLSSAKSCR